MKSGYCVFTDDPVNECVDLAREAGGIVVGSPVYYADPNGSLWAIFDRLDKYFTISSMPVVSSQYWNATHGFTPDATWPGCSNASKRPEARCPISRGRRRR
jgi:hypothetical protein